LFGDKPAKIALYQAVDSIRNRFGPQAIVRAVTR
jgi:hypothetical protein